VIRVTADTNIYISSLNFGGPPRSVIALAYSGDIQLAVSAPILDEIAHVLRDKFGLPEADIREAEADIRSIAELVVPIVHIEAVKDDPSDNRILECAVASRSEYIITGDKHLLRLGRFGEIRIVKAADFLAIAVRPI
jgi:putative PIN family toxin of toxin-antitoxin system